MTLSHLGSNLSLVSNRTALPGAIRAIRLAKDLPGSKVSIAAFMSPGHLANIESGKRVASEDAITLIARALDVPLEAISYQPAACMCGVPC